MSKENLLGELLVEIGLPVAFFALPIIVALATKNGELGANTFLAECVVLGLAFSLGKRA